MFCTRTQSVKSQQELCPNASEFESGLGFYDLAVYFKQWIDQKIDRSAFRLRIDHQIAPLGQLRSEEHTSELQSHVNLVCRLLLEKKKGICAKRAFFTSSTTATR